MKTKHHNGFMTLFLADGKLSYSCSTPKNEWESSYCEYDMIDGKEFLSLVEEEYLINYDGSIASIFIDGYKSNLGLFHSNGFCKGDFLIGERDFLEICDKHEVKVNWANK